DPKRKTGYLARAFAFNNGNHWPEAIADFSKALEIDPNDTVAHEDRGHAYSHLHDEDRGIADITETMRIKKANAAYKRRAASYALKGDYTRALVDLRDAAKAAPNDGA